MALFSFRYPDNMTSEQYLDSVPGRCNVNYVVERRSSGTLILHRVNDPRQISFARIVTNSDTHRAYILMGPVVSDKAFMEDIMALQDDFVSGRMTHPSVTGNAGSGKMP
jgi:hypothetical protein